MAARCAGYRDTAIETLHGAVRLKRHSYPCAACTQGFCPWGATLHLTAQALSPAAAERWIALPDGGRGLEDFLAKRCPHVEAVILDFWHAAAYLGEWSQALHPADADAAETWRSTWGHRLKPEGGQAVLDGLTALAVPRRARACWDKVRTYFANQVHRMDDPRDRVNGWQSGSGPVESAWKRVVGQRLKGAGMRWGEDGAHAVCPLRALFLSEKGLWEAFWTYAN